MRKIIILGSPGSGKSVFAVKLQKCTGLPLTHLDNIWWKSDRTHITRQEFDEKLVSVINTNEWIIDGDYSRTYEMRIKACDTVFFLDYSTSECIDGICERVGKKRPDMPWTEDKLAPDLLREVKEYRNKNRDLVLNLIHKYNKESFVFCNRRETEQWFDNFRFIG